MGLFSLRNFDKEDPEGDFEILHRLSNYQVPQDPEGNDEWLRNRRNFDESERHRRHYVAMDGDEAVGYASIEQERGTDRYRLFLVFDPRRSGFEEMGDYMYRKLLEDASELGADTLVFIEYANDRDFYEFLSRRGFAEAGRIIYNGFEIQRMERSMK